MQSSFSSLNPTKAKTNFNYIYIFGPYRAVNTLRLGYNNQPVKVE
jgi:hypothetical protein